MPGPRVSDAPRIRLALAVFRVSAALTGFFLIGLVVMMVLRYGFLSDIELGGPFGFIALTPTGQLTAINLSVVLLAVHGWLYVLYLLLDFALWRLTRWSFGRFLFIALGGVVPFLSFYFEFRVPRWTKDVLARLDAGPVSAEKVAAR